MLNCPLCNESVDNATDIAKGFHFASSYGNPIPVWDACIRAASGELPRLLRVFGVMSQFHPLLARAYDGDR